ncbi:hypothetical protein QAD02_018509 [Eretmocerus hayati]|uniref:Uncharacterized protein n=1 Tax=Eretmocerus hayati TaxID=131215 RepID=A0ACC2PH98_9HYME|nr:hypothetical protein QAD02_018509 [Eretmocerus hayati]
MDNLDIDLTVAVKVIDNNFIDEGALGMVSKNFNVSQEIVDEWFAALLIILKLHLRTPSISLKLAEFKQYLQELKFSPECVQDIISVSTGSKRPELMRNLAKKAEFLPHIISCKWET